MRRVLPTSLRCFGFRTITIAAVMSLLLCAGCASQTKDQAATAETSAHADADPRWNLSPQKARALINRVTPGRDLTPPQWPDGKKVAVLVTFDFDAELVWMRHPETVPPSTLSRGHYGARAGLPRILDLLERRELPATFFLPALIVELYPGAVESIQKSGRHEIGFHGYAHESIRTLTGAQERDALQRGMEIFRKAKIVPRSFRSPAWEFSPATAGLLRESGFRYDSSLMGDDRPHEILADGAPTGLIEFPVNWSLDDWPYFQLEWATPMPGLRDPDEVRRIWQAHFDAVRAEGGLMVLTLHPQVIGRPERIRMLEQLIDHMQSEGDVWFATVGQAGDYIRTYDFKTAP